MAENTSALLIGSGVFQLRKPNGGSGKPASKKGGIRQAYTKDGDQIPPGTWAIGDLDNMKDFIAKRGVDVFKSFNYTEKREDKSYALGKSDVLQTISDFFEQDKTYFILYYTGHGDGDGSWCFPVTKAVSGSQNLHTHDAATLTETAEPATGTSPEEAALRATVRTTSAEVHGNGEGAETGSRDGDGDALASDGGVEEDESITKTSQEGSQPSRVDEIESVSGQSNASIATLLTQYSIIEQPPPTEELNDFLTFEDVVEVWNEKKQGKGERYLMMILDCCHAGRWVQKINGETLEEEGENEQPASKFSNRRDICIQAACRPSETSMVADSQLGSVFTKAFVAAQSKSVFEKFILTVIDHFLVLNVVSIASSPVRRRFTPLSSEYAPFGDFKFFDSFDEMHLKS
jgi:hypothetical protein